jgi:hypothetical protein
VPYAVVAHPVRRLGPGRHVLPSPRRRSDRDARFTVRATSRPASPPPASPDRHARLAVRAGWGEDDGRDQRADRRASTLTYEPAGTSRRHPHGRDKSLGTAYSDHDLDVLLEAADPDTTPDAVGERHGSHAHEFTDA